MPTFFGTNTYIGGIFCILESAIETVPISFARPSATEMSTSSSCCQQASSGMVQATVGLSSQAKGMGAYQTAVHGSSNLQGGQILAPPGLHHLQVAQHRPVLPMPGGSTSTVLPQQRPAAAFNTGQMVPAGHVVQQGTQLLSHRLQSGQLIQPGNPGQALVGNPARGQLPSSFSRSSGQLMPDPTKANIDRVQSQTGLTQQQVLSSGHILLPGQEQGQHVTDSAGRAVHARGVHLDDIRTSAIPHGVVSNSRTIIAQPEVPPATSDPRLSEEQGLQWSREVEEEERIARLEQAQQAGEISNKSTSQSGQEPLRVGEWETVKSYGRGGSKRTLHPDGAEQIRTRDDRIQEMPAPVKSQGHRASGVPGVLPVPGHLRRDQATSVSGLTAEEGGHHGGAGRIVEARSGETFLPQSADDLARY